MACLFWMTFLKARTSRWMDELMFSADVKLKDQLKHEAILFFVPIFKWKLMTQISYTMQGFQNRYEAKGV